MMQPEERRRRVASRREDGNKLPLMVRRIRLWALECQADEQLKPREDDKSGAKKSQVLMLPLFMCLRENSGCKKNQDVNKVSTTK